VRLAPTCIGGVVVGFEIDRRAEIRDCIFRRSGAKPW
jgi:hypothetical protein